MERALTPAELSRLTGLPDHAIRAACRRGDGFHPLPHIKSGEKRPRIYIMPHDFELWLEEETHARA